ncbi:MAG: DUF4105 domain-containing protein [Bryobacteraceae bacterium]
MATRALKWTRRLARVAGYTAVFLFCAWATAALYFDLPIESLRATAAAAFAILTVALFALRERSAALFGLFVLSPFLVAGWWFSLTPSNQRNWQRDVAEMPWAEVRGNQATIHNVRNFEYRTETDYTPHWETRTVDVSAVRAVDLFISRWGAPGIAHALVSFEFADGQYLAMSIEARKEVGESYSAIAGFFRRYELIYVVADERDVVRLRTSYRADETVSLFRTMTRPDDARKLFLQYLRWMNATRDQPRWYNALTRNCSIGVTNYLAAEGIGGISRWDWRNLFNSSGDEMLYNLGDLSTDGLSLAALRQRAVINQAAKAADGAADFSRRIRAGRPGFGSADSRQQTDEFGPTYLLAVPCAAGDILSAMAETPGGLGPKLSAERVSFEHWDNCWRLTNGIVDLMIPEGFGPRIMRFGFCGSQNVLKTFDPPEPGMRVRGGHRMWLAPEVAAFTWVNDSVPVQIAFHEHGLHVTGAIEPESSMQKEMIISLAASGGGVRILHRATNRGDKPVQIAPWSLSQMAAGGCAVSEFPPRGEHPRDLLPTGSLVMWAYTDFSDPKWSLLRKYWILRQDAGHPAPQKAGLFLDEPWGAYLLGDELFIKRSNATPGVEYPDMGCSFEAFVNGAMLELETLGSLRTVAPGESAEHEERWSLHRQIEMTAWTDSEIDARILPLVHST